MFSVLIVEDDQNIQFLMSILLLKQGYDVTRANNGFDALAILARNPSFDLIITNIQMPIMSGVALIAELKRLFPLIPLLIITAFSERLPVQALQREFASLAKPFSRAQFLKAVAQCMSLTR
jgi:CheY-like chemotaxis protein